MKAIIILILLILGGYLLWAQTDHWSEAKYMKTFDKIQDEGVAYCKQKGLDFNLAFIQDFETYNVVCSSSSPPKTYPFIVTFK